MNLETVTNLIIVTGAVALGFAVVISWLGSIHRQESSHLVSRGWFTLPDWAQVIFGFAAIGLFIWLGSVFWLPLPLRLSKLGATVLHPIGLVIFLVGLFLSLWARRALGAIYGVSTGSSAPLQEKHRLVQRGPYAFIRHPMYLGYWLVMLGVLLIYSTWTPLALLIITVPSFWRRARREEISLEENFGLKWQVYATNVPMFMPRWKKNL